MIQDVLVRVNDEVVLRGNSGLMKCAVPSYVADFVSVDAWIDDVDGGVVVRRTDAGDGNETLGVANPPHPPPTPRAQPEIPRFETFIGCK